MTFFNKFVCFLCFVCVFLCLVSSDFLPSFFTVRKEWNLTWSVFQAKINFGNHNWLVVPHFNNRIEKKTKLLVLSVQSIFLASTLSQSSSPSLGLRLFGPRLHTLAEMGFVATKIEWSRVQISRWQLCSWRKKALCWFSLLDGLESRWEATRANCWTLKLRSHSEESCNA